MKFSEINKLSSLLDCLEKGELPPIELITAVRQAEQRQRAIHRARRERLDRYWRGGLP